MVIKTYKELIVWQKSIDLVAEVYKITKAFPKSELYALCSQIQRAAVSIPSNIAEGYGRNHRPEFIQFLGISYGSACELETQLVIAKKLYPELNYEVAFSLLNEVQKMLGAMLRKLKPDSKR